MSNHSIHSSRHSYQRSILLESNAAQDPFTQLQAWLNDAEQEGYMDFNAMTLSTVGEMGYPHSRIVLLRSISKDGLKFFTNYASNKGREIEFCDKVCANFYWNTMERQVRLNGVAKRVTDQESDDYFKARPRESQIGAWASPQSQEIRTREELEERVNHYNKQFEGIEVPRPPHWGGFRIIPHYFEFWQGRPGRLHDRLIYKVDSDFNWYLSRLAP